MDELLKSLKRSVKHLETLDKVFGTFEYPEKDAYLRNRQKIRELNAAYSKKLTDELYYGDDGRQMILNDILEYIFTARGYFYMWRIKDIEKKRNFVKLVLYFINQLMIFESISVNHNLRNRVLDELQSKIGAEFFLNENSQITFDALKRFKGYVHLPTQKTNIVSDRIIAQLGLETNEKALARFDAYTDSILPKLPHGLWRELIVYLQLLRINAGIVIPMLLNQRIISKNDFMKPTDFLVITDSGDLVAVEVGGGKDTQTSNFSARMKCQLVTATNTNIPPRCPICGKWVTFCDKVIEEFSDLDDPLYHIYDDVRCAHDCELYTYDQVLAGECPHVKYRGLISKESNRVQETKFTEKYEFHYHYSCILKSKDTMALNEIKRQKKRWEAHLKKVGSIDENSRRLTINCLKTNYPYFDGLDGLKNYNQDNLICYSKYLNNDNCPQCPFEAECKKLSILYPLIDEIEIEDNREQLKEELKKLIRKSGAQ